MSEEEPKALQRLRWWFWLVLFAPAMISLAAPAMGNLLGPHHVLGTIVFVNTAFALPLNFVCSNWAAKQIVLRRDSRGGSSPWMFLWGPLIFFLNVALVFGGCSAMEHIARSTR